MNNVKYHHGVRIAAGIVCAVLVWSGQATPSSAAQPPASAAAPPPVPQTAPAAAPQRGQLVFSSATAAAAALLAAVRAQDHQQLHRIFGPAIRELVSGDPVEDRQHFQEFVRHATERFWLEKQTAAKSIVHIGKKDWPFPIPIVRAADGRWFFDTKAGAQEILARRIGANELETIKVCGVYVEAQREYASKDRDHRGVLEYAQRLVSTPGHHDGLYWPAVPGQPESPFGPLVAEASAEGYTVGNHHRPEPFHGYFYHILKAQGPGAPGGAYNYVINGNMIAGFALVAFPAKYGDSGIMTFIVNQQGKVFQKDLGPDTLKLARHMTTYNPDRTWTLVQQ